MNEIDKHLKPEDIPITTKGGEPNIVRAYLEKFGDAAREHLAWMQEEVWELRNYSAGFYIPDNRKTRKRIRARLVRMAVKPSNQ